LCGKALSAVVKASAKGFRGQCREEKDAMLWLFAGSGLAGLLLGWWFRVPALIAVSTSAAVISMAAATLMGLGLSFAAGLTFALLGTLQVGYIAGLMLSCAWARVKFPLAERYMLEAAKGLSHFRVRARPGSCRKT
jgi:predicted benzoate:H+ symporter BenE